MRHQMSTSVHGDGYAVTCTCGLSFSGTKDECISVLVRHQADAADERQARK